MTEQHAGGHSPELDEGRRHWLRMGAAGGLGAVAAAAGAQSFDFKPNQRYPDPSVQLLEPSFGKYRILTRPRARSACFAARRIFPTACAVTGRAAWWCANTSRAA